MTGSLFQRPTGTPTITQRHSLPPGYLTIGSVQLQTINDTHGDLTPVAYLPGEETRLGGGPHAEAAGHRDSSLLDVLSHQPPSALQSAHAPQALAFQPAVHPPSVVDLTPLHITPANAPAKAALAGKKRYAEVLLLLKTRTNQLHSPGITAPLFFLFCSLCAFL